MKNISPYQLGILWSIGYYDKDKKRFVLRHKERYFLEQLQDMTSGNIYYQVNAGKEQYVLMIHGFDIEQLRSMNWTERNADIRYLPVLDDYRDFLRAYLEIHSTLDYSTRYSKSKSKSSKWKALRLRIYGNINLLEEINRVFHIEIKTPIRSLEIKPNRKTGILPYTSLPQIERIYRFIEEEPCHEAYWIDAYKKMRNPKIEFTYF